MAIMLISHNLAVVSEMADDIAVMYLGKRVEFGTADAIFDNPLHPYTQGLWRSIPSVDGPLEKLVPIPGAVPSPRDLPPGCVFASRCSELCPASAMHRNRSRLLRRSRIILLPVYLYGNK